jgi:hypothetical protein
VSKRTPQELATEAAVIVLSILLAFAIDAAWGQRVERAEENRILEQFAAELDSYDELLALAAASSERVLTATDVLLRAIHEGPTPEADVLSNALRGLQGRFRFTSTTATLDLLAGSGNLGIISSPALRQVMSDLAVAISIVRTLEEEEGVFLDEHLRPYLRLHTDRASFAPTDERGMDGLESRFVWAPDGLLSEREFANLVMERRRGAYMLRNFRGQIGDASRRSRVALAR